MRLGSFTKTPAERKRYAVDYTDWLDITESLQNVTFAVTPATTTPFVVDAVSTNPANTTVVFFVSGGDTGKQYTVDVKAYTTGGQTKEDIVLFSQHRQKIFRGTNVDVSNKLSKSAQIFNFLQFCIAFP